MEPKKIGILGCGISGLATGIRLAREGFKVKIMAKSLPPGTTSDKAAAFWSPYYAEGDQVARWALESYFEYERLSKTKATGISMTTLHRFRKNSFEDAEDWEAAIPPGRLHVLGRDELPKGYDEGFAVEVPLIETQIFLPWLMDEFKATGGSIEVREVHSLDELYGNDSLLINCTGLGARALMNDMALIPVKGQVLMVDAHLNIPITLDENEPTYIVQRKDGCILGGTREENIFSETTDEETLLAILERASKFYPQLKSAKRIKQWAGLRPYRNEVRVEREGNILHNYGHGGSGFTLAWGCANEILRLVGQF